MEVIHAALLIGKVLSVKRYSGRESERQRERWRKKKGEKKETGSPLGRIICLVFSSSVCILYQKLLLHEFALSQTSVGTDPGHLEEPRLKPVMMEPQ